MSPRDILTDNLRQSLLTNGITYLVRQGGALPSISKSAEPKRAALELVVGMLGSMLADPSLSPVERSVVQGAIGKARALFKSIPSNPKSKRTR